MRTWLSLTYRAEGYCVFFFQNFTLLCQPVILSFIGGKIAANRVMFMQSEDNTVS
jgi:hypothetical protein